MKICLIFSSYEGSGSVFQDYDGHLDPSLYVKSHEFIRKFIRKETAKAEIDQICAKGYDLYWSFLWGAVQDSVAGVEALKYLESKQVPLLGPSSKFLSMSKEDVKILVKQVGVKTPKWTMASSLNLEGMKFPLIVKLGVGCGSLHMTSDSVCNNEAQVMEQISLMKTKVDGKRDILIEEFIIGDEISCGILETPEGPIALRPHVFNFPKEWDEKRKFIDFNNKFTGIVEGWITFRIYDEEMDIQEKIRETAIKAYTALGVLGSGYAGVDMRMTKDKQIYVLEVNPSAPIFYPPGNEWENDSLIEKTFSGGHEEAMEKLLAAKMRLQGVSSTFSAWSSAYGKSYEVQNMGYILKKLIADFGYNGNVLDLGCGSGYVGNIIMEKYTGSSISGIDTSTKMADISLNVGYNSVKVGLIENLIPQINDNSYDHVICIGVLPFIDPHAFNQVLPHMFRIAQSSVSFTIEDVPPEYNDALVRVGYPQMVSFNHTKAFEEFISSPSWELVHKEHDFFWKSEHTGIKVYGLMIRYERKSVQTNGNGFSH